MHRDLSQLTAGTFDVLVVGGGIYGLAIAYDAAQRGLSVALIDRGDFGSGSSFNHLRTIHGGLRYLQTLDLSRARESVRERRAMATIAPHAVKPMPFALPLYRSLTRGRLAMRAGFALDRLVSFDRNRGVVPSHRLPAGRVVSSDTAAQCYPGLRRSGLTGAAVWYDYVATEADRLTFSFALAAAEHHAVLANHVEAAALNIDGGRVVGVRAVDTLDAAGRSELMVRAQVTVIATGGLTDSLLGPIGASTGMPTLKAMNVVTRREAGDVALGGKAPSGRNLFLVPWRGRALFGTWESAEACDPGAATVSASELADFMSEINAAFPSLDLTREDVTLVHRGIVPAVAGKDGRVALEGHERVRDHAVEGTGGTQGSTRLDGLVSVAGAKYTTARGVAERVTDRLIAKLKKPSVRCQTATIPLPGGRIADMATAIGEARRDHDADLPSDAIPHLIEAYGSRYGAVLALCAKQPELNARVSDESPVIAAELVWAVREELAMTLEDAVVRRTPLGALGYPGDPVVTRAAAIVGVELQWSQEQTEREVAALKGFYASMAP
jgi:glycerol-3-phosphate dehydrogenase